MADSYLDNLPFGSEYDPPERIVCAANRYGRLVIAGVRHGCETMQHIHGAFENRHIDMNEDFGEEEQGFLTSKHHFVDRQEAWKIAVEQKQIVRRVGGDSFKGGTLYSENLY